MNVICFTYGVSYGKSQVNWKCSQFSLYLPKLWKHVLSFPLMQNNNEMLRYCYQWLCLLLTCLPFAQGLHQYLLIIMSCECWCFCLDKCSCVIPDGNCQRQLHGHLPGRNCDVPASVSLLQSISFHEATACLLFAVDICWACHARCLAL